MKTKYLISLSIIIELTLFYFYYFPETKIFFGDEQRYFNTGLSIAAGGDWHANPLWPPMQSILIALFATLFDSPLLALQIFQYGLLLFAGFIIRDIVWRETNNIRSAQLSLAIMILYPGWLAYSQYLWPEVIHVTLFVSIIWVNSYKNNSYKWMLLSGLLIGLAILFKSLLILFIPFLFLPSLLHIIGGHSSLKSVLVKIVFSLLIATIVITPASLKAHKMTGGWMVSNSSMFNLCFGLNDDKRQNFAHDIGGALHAEYLKSADNHQQRSQIAKNNALKKMQDDGYINTFLAQMAKQYFRLFDYQSFFSQQFQGEKSDNYVNKYHHHSDDLLVKIVLILNNVFYFILMLAMFLGAFVSVTRSVIAKQFALFLLYVLALFVLLHTKPRFRIPLVPVMAFYAAYLHCYLVNKKWQLSQLLTNKKQLLLIVVFVMAITVLVFSAQLLDKILPI
ncbi:MAG: glycosyltransferase family 39 protein [Alcanivoracaceae bacterium]|nr:glycosyltransferase family 39 protein [Alcanivoracaceae bacterium]